jgi:hypothetical protein
MNPALSMEGTTATHSDDPRTSSGIPWSPAFWISSSTVAAAFTRSVALDSVAGVLEADAVDEEAGVPEGVLEEVEESVAGAGAAGAGVGVAGASCAKAIPVRQTKRHKTATFFMGKAFLIEVMFVGCCF